MYLTYYSPRTLNIFYFLEIIKNNVINIINSINRESYVLY